MRNKYIEIAIHLLFWLFYFTAVNVEWTSNWFDRSLRPNTPSPLIVIIFPLYFYANAFWLLPKYFNRKKWMYYFAFAALVFIGPELLRSLLYTQFYSVKFSDQIFSRDSFLFGAPSAFFLALNGSFIYRFTKDWFVNKAIIRDLESKSYKQDTPAYENVSLLTPLEIDDLSSSLEAHMNNNSAYLNADLTLRELADAINTSEKKLSFLLNQKLETNFYDYLNKFRIEAFKTELAKEVNQHLSIVGIAMNCGFKSKSSFYRAFKANVGKSPSQYLEEIKKI